MKNAQVGIKMRSNQIGLDIVRRQKDFYAIIVALLQGTN